MDKIKIQPIELSPRCMRIIVVVDTTTAVGMATIRPIAKAAQYTDARKAALLSVSAIPICTLYVDIHPPMV